MQTSELINEIATALAKAQAKIEGAKKGTKNTFFNSSYADLAAVWDEVREPLTENAISVVQSAEHFDAGIVVTTLLMHSSGQWIRVNTPPLIPKDRSPQAVGSCLTYGRRYGLASAVGCPQVDDDGNAASGRPAERLPLSGDINPRGDLGKDIPTDTLVALSDRMREAMAKDSRSDTEVASDVFVIHDEIKTDADIYTAASDLLRSDERRAWKKYVDIHKAAQLSKRSA